MRLADNLSDWLFSEFVSLRGVGADLSHGCPREWTHGRCFQLLISNKQHLETKVTAVLGVPLPSWMGKQRMCLAPVGGQAPVLRHCPQKDDDDDDDDFLVIIRPETEAKAWLE